MYSCVLAALSIWLANLSRKPVAEISCKTIQNSSRFSLLSAANCWYSGSRWLTSDWQEWCVIYVTIRVYSFVQRGDMETTVWLKYCLVCTELWTFMGSLGCHGHTRRLTIQYQSCHCIVRSTSLGYCVLSCLFTFTLHFVDRLHYTWLCCKVPMKARLCRRSIEFFLLQKVMGHYLNTTYSCGM